MQWLTTATTYLLALSMVLAAGTALAVLAARAHHSRSHRSGPRAN